MRASEGKRLHPRTNLGRSLRDGTADAGNLLSKAGTESRYFRQR